MLAWNSHACMHAALVVSACEMCSGEQYSLESSASVAECGQQCAVAPYNINRTTYTNSRLNLPEASRTYSSFSIDHIYSMLDTTTSHATWCASNADATPYIDIDAGEPMLISGIITQGRTGTNVHYVSGFEVKSRLNNSLFDDTVRVFTPPDRSEQTHMFVNPVYAQHIRITPQVGMLQHACALDWLCSR